MVTAASAITAEISAEVNTLAEIERALVSIFAHRDGNLSISSTTLGKRRGAFHDPALLQAIATWARLSPSGKLKLSGISDPQKLAKALEDCGQYSVGVGALAIAPEISALDTTIGKATALSPAAARMNAAFEGNFELLQKGRCVDLICISGADRQYLKPLFSRVQPPIVKDKFSLKSTVRGLALQAHPKADEILDDAAYSALATLTHELFENTQEHAVSDTSSKPYRRHFESIFVSWLSLSDTVVQDDFMANGVLRDYWATIADTQPSREAVAGLCFSFLDTGPGMASRLLGREYVDMTEIDERAALLACLKIHVSTKSSKAAGGGLSEVLTEVAAMNGMVRIRSGRMSIFRCYPPGADETKIEEGFLNWFGDDRTLTRVAGTLVSIFIPLPKN